jgi:hypothetical protein
MHRQRVFWGSVTVAVPDSALGYRSLDLMQQDPYVLRNSFQLRSGGCQGELMQNETVEKWRELCRESEPQFNSLIGMVARTAKLLRHPIVKQFHYAVLACAYAPCGGFDTRTGAAHFG